MWPLPFIFTELLGIFPATLTDYRSRVMVFFSPFPHSKYTSTYPQPLAGIPKKKKVREKRSLKAFRQLIQFASLSSIPCIFSLLLRKCWRKHSCRTWFQITPFTAPSCIEKLRFVRVSGASGNQIKRAPVLERLSGGIGTVCKLKKA